MGYATKRYLLYTGIATALSILGTVSGAPNMNMDPTSILFPDKYDEMRREYALQQCQDNPRCKTGLFFAGIPDACNALRDTITRPHTVGVRTSGEKCNPFAGEVVWPATGQCVQLLTQGPCPDGYWIKLQLSDLEPQCDPRPCDNDEVLTEGNKCHNGDDGAMCPPGLSLLTNEFGTAECDCQPGMVYHSLTNQCYEPYSQGPCPPGQMIKVFEVQGRGEAHCVANPCPAPNMVLLDRECQVLHISSEELATFEGTCYTIGTRGPCITGILAIDAMLMEPVCLLETSVYSIFNLPNLRGCPKGGIRDSHGRCRTPFRFRHPRGCQRGSRRDGEGRCRRGASQLLHQIAPTPTSRPGVTSGSICPKGEVILAGVCYRLALSPYTA